MIWVSQACHSPTCWSSTGCKTKPWECYLLELPSMETRQKMEQIKAYLSMTMMQNPKNPLCCQRRKEVRLARGKSWMGQAKQSIQHECNLTELKQGRDWEKQPVEFKPYETKNLGMNCWERPAGKANAEVQMLVEATANHMTVWSAQIAQSQWTTDQSGGGFMV